MDLARLIDHTCIAPGAVGEDIDRLCDESVRYGFHSACVSPVWVGRAAARLANTGVRVCTTVGFPHGNTLSSVKSAEAETVMRMGADEVDMVIHIGALRSGDLEATAADIALVADLVHGKDGALLKVILETALLGDDEIVAACRVAETAGADFVKTSTGFGPGGATVEAVRLMRVTVGDRLGVKASGGIRDYATAKAMVDAGANRIGSSASVAIVESAP